MQHKGCKISDLIFYTDIMIIAVVCFTAFLNRETISAGAWITFVRTIAICLFSLLIDRLIVAPSCASDRVDDDKESEDSVK